MVSNEHGITREIAIRMMTDNDLDAVLSIEKISSQEPWSEKLFQQELKTAISNNYLAIIDNSIAGFIVFWLVAEEIQIHNIAVNPDVRRRGVGSYLLRKMAEYSLGQGANTVTLEVRRSNIDAIKLYEKFGFVVNGVRSSYYLKDGEDALIMLAKITDIVKR